MEGGSKPSLFFITKPQHINKNGDDIMLMWIFLLFFGLGLILTIAGFAMDIAVLNIAGTIMLFLMGLGMLQDGLDYKIGEQENYIYGNNFSNFNGTIPDNISDNAFVVGKTVDPIYGSYDDANENRFGWLLMAMGALAFSLSLFRL